MKIGIMGYGHIGHSIVNGLLRGELVPSEQIIVCEKDDVKRAEAEALGVLTCPSLPDTALQSDIVFLALTPPVFKEIFTSFSDRLAGKTVISCIAGVTVADLNTKLPNAHIVRTMPNLGIATCNGFIAYTETDNIEVVRLLNGLCTEKAYCFDEKDFPAVMAYASCGVGFAAFLLQCYYDKGVQLGFDEQTNHAMLQNIFDIAFTAADFSALARAVAVKGGATEAGLAHMESNHLADIISNALDLSCARMGNK